MAGPRLATQAVSAATSRSVGPSVVKEICSGLVVGIIGGGIWKIYHLNERRKAQEFYSMLEKGEIGVVVEEA